MEPKWEDPTCEHGGKWTVPVPRGPNNKQTLDTYWLNAVRPLAASVSVQVCENMKFSKHRASASLYRRIRQIRGLCGTAPENSEDPPAESKRSTVQTSVRQTWGCVRATSAHNTVAVPWV